MVKRDVLLRRTNIKKKKKKSTCYGFNLKIYSTGIYKRDQTSANNSTYDGYESIKLNINGIKIEDESQIAEEFNT